MLIREKVRGAFGNSTPPKKSQKHPTLHGTCTSAFTRKTSYGSFTSSVEKRHCRYKKRRSSVLPSDTCSHDAVWRCLLVQVRLHQDLRAVLDPVEEGTYRRDVVQARLKQPLRTWRCRVSGSEGSSAPAAQTTGAFSLCHTFICMQPFCSTFKCLGIYLQNRSKRSYGER